MRARQALSIIGAALLASAGCGRATLNTGETETDASPPPDSNVVPDLCTGDVALENAWQCTVDVVCGLVAECFGGSFTVETCRELDLEIFDMSARYGEIMMLSAIQQGTITYNGQALGRCLDDLRALSCTALFASEDPFDACAGFAGTVDPGGACVFDAECGLPGSTCETPNCTDGDVCCMGACTQPVPVGSTCTGDECAPGAYCVNGICEEGRANSPCFGDYTCDPENWCSNPTGGAGTCAPDYAIGSACTDDDQCPSPATCVGTNMPNGGTCQRSIETGDPCDGTCTSFVSHYCDRPDLTALGTCQPRFGEGAACDPEIMPCEISLRCDPNSLTCQRYGEEGTPCTSGSECAFFGGTYCSNEIDNAAQGVCQGRLPDGAACDSTRHCESGYCYQSVCTAVAACY